MQRLKNLIALIRLHLHGYFPYFGTRVYSPPNSILFRRVRQEGVFERQTCDCLQHLATPESWYCDVGANLGLTSVPVLASNPTVRVISIEPSPNSFPYLARTHETASFRDRWHLESKAISDTTGTTSFVLSGEDSSAFEGIRDTGRVEMSHCVNVEMATLDDIWAKYERPHVSLIKVDVEGAESKVLQGAAALIKTCRPNIVLEWSVANLRAYNLPLEWLLQYATEHEYLLFDLESFAPVTLPEHLRMLSQQMRENFLLAPRDLASVSEIIR